MKRLLLLPLGLLLLASCTEKGPVIDFGPKAEEKSYMAPVEAQDPRMVLIEEFTGVTCPTCPDGHKALKAISDNNPGRVAIVGIQPTRNIQTRPYDHGGIKSKNDNRSEEGTEMADAIFGNIGAIPVASFDRVPQNNVILPYRGDWPSYMQSRVNTPAKANIKVTSTYDDAKRQAVIKIRVAYTSPVTNGQMLNVYLVENDVVDVQELPVGSPEIVDQNYSHQHVLRDIITTSSGSAFLDTMATKPAGLVYERTIIYDLPALDLKNTVQNPANCHIIAFISNNNGSDKEVVQATEAPLK